jgi:hypothetical protein
VGSGLLLVESDWKARVTASREVGGYLNAHQGRSSSVER